MKKSQGKERQRKSYQKPQIVSQEIYETMALACNKCSDAGVGSTSKCRPTASNFT